MVYIHQNIQVSQITCGLFSIICTTILSSARAHTLARARAHTHTHTHIYELV